MERNRRLPSGVEVLMRGFRAVMIGLLLCLRSPAPMIPALNLAKRIEVADEIVIAKLVSGMTFASGSQVSNDIVLRVDRVLKGSLTPGSEIAAHLQGRGYFVVPSARQSAMTQKLYGIWFLSTATRPYTVISRDGSYGEIGFASVTLSEEAPRGARGGTPASSVANELLAELRWIAETHGAQLSRDAQRKGTPEQRTAAALYSSQFRYLADNFGTLDLSTTRPAYRQLAGEKSVFLRAIGIQGLIAANDPEGVKRAAADWDELSAEYGIAPVIGSLMAFSNGADGEAVRALGALALREPAEPGLRESAAYALRAIHSKESIPALVKLLDDKEAGIRLRALSGLCLFIRNAPEVTPDAVRSMSWLQSRPPTPLLNPEMQRFCLLGGVSGRPEELDEYVRFWKSWWSEHRAEIESR